MVNMVTNVVPEKQMREAQLRALKLFYDVVKHTYGPMGAYTSYTMGDPKNPKNPIYTYYTKDGFKTLSHIMIDKPIESQLVTDITDICRSVVKKIGDGTTSATMLSYLVFKGLVDLQNAQYPKRLLIKAFKQIIKEATDIIKENGRSCTVEDIYNIAYTSLNGNEVEAKIIADIYKDCGMGVFIDVQGSNTDDTVIKTYNGMSYNEGYISPAFINDSKSNKCILEQPEIYVFDSPIDTPDMQQCFAWILTERVYKPIEEYRNGKNTKPAQVLIICPSISRDANSLIDSVINSLTTFTPEERQRLCVVANINNTTQYLMDIKAMTGAKFIKKYIDPLTKKRDEKAGLVMTEKNVKTFAGHAARAVIDSLSTTIINPENMYDENGEYSKFFNQYISELESTLQKYEETREEIVKIGDLKRRINILKSQMVDLYVGGISVTDRQALTDSVEDAVLNCRSAASEGVTYGANYAGLYAFNEIEKKYYQIVKPILESDTPVKLTQEDQYNRTLYRVARIFNDAYLKLVCQIYAPYCDMGNKEEAMMDAMKIVLTGLSNQDLDKRCPFNLFTEEYDGKVLTSVRTEPSILEAISKIISVLFDTNQALLSSALYNIYTVEDPTLIEGNKEEVKEKAQKLEDIKITDI